MIVELDLFSGRPNPRWGLSPDQAEEFTRLLSHLPEQASPVVDRGILGYRGLILYEAEDAPRTVVGMGEVIQHTAGNPLVYRDEGRKIEKWLLGTAKGQVDLQVLKIIESLE